jgi:hypothetical protein
MTEIKVTTARKLFHVANMAIEFVGSANYEKRERWAKYQLEQAFKNALMGRDDQIKFDPRIPENF